MKQKLFMAAICLFCALFLYGCGSAPTEAPASPAPSAAPAESAAPVEETSVPAESAEPAGTPAPVAALPDAGLVPDTGKVGSEADALFELAKSFVDKPFSELQAEIGEPVSVSYVSSCLVPGGQDGELHYDGFTVYTVKSGDSETVQDVLAD